LTTYIPLGSGGLATEACPCPIPHNGYVRLNSFRSFRSTFARILGESSPSSRRMIVIETVISRCRRRVEDTRSPVIEKSACFVFSTRSVSSKFGGTWLVMNAKTT